MYYRVAIRREGDQLDRPPSWQWKSTALSSLQALLQFLRLYGALPQDQLRVFSSSAQAAQRGATVATWAKDLRDKHAAMRTAQAVQQEATVATSSFLREYITTTGAPESNCLSLLDKKRLEIELGPGGDHDVPLQLRLAYLTAASPCMDEAAGQGPSWGVRAVGCACRQKQPSHQSDDAGRRAAR